MTLRRSTTWPVDYPSDYAVVDVETTGLTRADRIVSVAVELLDGQGTVTGRWSTLVDPLRDPGPVHIHGLTTERLAGAPTFDKVADDLSEYLAGRVLVAHNAPFDWGMLTAEYARIDATWPMERRLCTMALARHLELPVENYRLATLAEHYRVRQLRAHDAVDDARVLSEVFRLGLHDAAGVGLPLPLTVPGAGGSRGRRPATGARGATSAGVAKTPCPWANPGRLDLSAGLIQGMRVVFTGDSGQPREALEARAAAAGLYVTGAVSGRTSVLVTNDPGSGSGKNRKAAELGTPVVDEATFTRLLADVRPGTASAAVPAPRATPDPIAVPDRVVAPVAPEQPTRTRRPTVRQVMVLAGRDEHAEGGRVRQLVSDSGARLRVNLTPTVDTVLVLPGAVDDTRITRARELGIACLDEARWTAAALAAPVVEPAPAAAPGGGATLPRGGNIVLPGGSTPGRWTLNASWAWDRPDEGVDIVAFLLDEDERVRGDADFLFWNQPAAPLDVVTLDTSGPAEQTVTLELDVLPRDVHRVSIAAALDGGSTFAAVGPIELDVAPFQGTSFVRSVLDAATVERVLLIGTFYRYGNGWKFRTVGQGHEFDLAGLAASFGVDVRD